MAPLVLVVGQQFGAPPPGLPETRSGARYVFADDLQAVRAHIAEAEVIFHYGQPRDALKQLWSEAENLRWVHIGNIGVDWALFPALVASEVVVTNSRGIFDVTLPEYALAMMLALVKDIPGTVRNQQEQRWQHRSLEPLSGQRSVILGAGSIGRALGRLLRAMGLSVNLVGATGRTGDAHEGRVHGVAELHTLLPATDWLICAVPLTPASRGLIGAPELALLPRGARLVNIGRGPVVVETALLEALSSGALAGAALDVFETEPLPVGHPLWSIPNVIISPHIGGDVGESGAAFSRSFLANLGRYLEGQPLHDVVDKALGYVPTKA